MRTERVDEPSERRVKKSSPVQQHPTRLLMLPDAAALHLSDWYDCASWAESDGEEQQQG